MNRQNTLRNKPGRARYRLIAHAPLFLGHHLK
jgi:hypothetical protein